MTSGNIKMEILFVVNPLGRIQLLRVAQQSSSASISLKTTLPPAVRAGGSVVFSEAVKI